VKEKMLAKESAPATKRQSWWMLYFMTVFDSKNDYYNTAETLFSQLRAYLISHSLTFPLSVTAQLTLTKHKNVSTNSSIKYKLRYLHYLHSH